MEGGTVSSYFVLSHAFLESKEGDNDGLVGVESAQWGEFMGTIPADHMDEIGHRYDFSAQPFETGPFYLSEAHRLFSLGL